MNPPRFGKAWCWGRSWVFLRPVLFCFAFACVYVQTQIMDADLCAALKAVIADRSAARTASYAARREQKTRTTAEFRRRREHGLRARHAQKIARKHAA